MFLLIWMLHGQLQVEETSCVAVTQFSPMWRLSLVADFFDRRRNRLCHRRMMLYATWGCAQQFLLN